MAKRNRTEIINDMLCVARDRGRTKPTHLMYKANLSHNQMKLYLAELEEKGMILKKEGKLEITDKGRDFCAKFSKMREFEKTFGL